MSETVFSKILKGEIPSYKVYEDEYTYAFLDISQVSKGHTLVIPKNAAPDMLSIDPSDLQHVITSVQKVAKAVDKAFDQTESMSSRIIELLQINLYFICTSISSHVIKMM